MLLGASSRKKGGTSVYAYNFNENDIKTVDVVQIDDNTNNYFGNDKGVIVNLEIFGKPIRIVSLHTKDLTKTKVDNTVEGFVEGC